MLLNLPSTQDKHKISLQFRHDRTRLLLAMGAAREEA